MAETFITVVTAMSSGALVRREAEAEPVYGLDVNGGEIIQEFLLPFFRINQ